MSNAMNDNRRVAITGLGVITPVGLGIEETFDALAEKKCGIERVTAFDAGRFTSQIAGEVKTGKVKDCVPKSHRKAVKVMARDIELAVIAAYLAVKDAGLKTKCIVDRGEVEGPTDIDCTRFGANIGAGLICADLKELAGALAVAAKKPESVGDRGFSLAKWGNEGMTHLTPLWLLKFLPNMLACHVTIVHDCQAPSNTLTCGEASSHLAIGEAYRTIKRGAADICICGGAESKINPMGMIRPALWGRLATDYNDRPAEACRPFDKDGSGTVASEGSGLIILEEMERAKSRGAKIYGEVVGFGAAGNATHWLKPQKDGRSFQLAMSKAMTEAGVSPDDIDFVNPFGSGIRERDASEAAAIRGVFGDKATSVPVMATKGALGNNGAGSGAIDIALSVMAMERGIIPPSQNTDQVDPDCDLNVVRGNPMYIKANLSLTFAGAMSGGQAAALVIRRCCS